MSIPSPYSIENLNITDDLEELGMDSVTFEFDILMKKERYLYFISFYSLMKHANQYFPADAAYFNQVRNSIPGFGPKHTKMIAIIQEEDFDIMPLLRHYIDTNCKIENLRKPVQLSAEEQQKLQETFERLQQKSHSIKSYNLRDTEFSDDALKYLTAKAVEIYPEIINSEPHYIKDLEKILVTHIMQMSTEIMDLASAAADDDESAS